MKRENEIRKNKNEDSSDEEKKRAPKKRKSEIQKLTEAWCHDKEQIRSFSDDIKSKGEIVWVPENEDIIGISEGSKYLYVTSGDITTKDDEELSTGSVVTMTLPRQTSIRKTDEMIFRMPDKIVLGDEPTPVSTTRKNSNKVIEKADLRNGSKKCPEPKRKKPQLKKSQTSKQISPPIDFSYKALMEKSPFEPEEEVKKSSSSKKKKSGRTKAKKKTVNKPVLSVCTWNVNHLSDATPTSKKKAPLKVEGILSILEEYSPDIIVLQEVNLYSEIALEKWEVKTTEKKKITYDWAEGPLLKAGNFAYRKRTGTQYEYYALAFNEKKVQLLEEYVLITYTNWDMTVTKNEFVKMKESKLEEEEGIFGFEWKEHRPLVVAIMQFVETGEVFALGIVHTSPSFYVEVSTAEYIRAMEARFQDVPWILAGDWYVEQSSKVTLHPLKEQTLEKLTDSFELGFFAPDENTNFPKDHEKGKKKTSDRKTPEGMVADYILTDKCWDTLAKTEVEAIRTKVITQERLEENEISDHSPVLATLQLDPTKKIPKEFHF